MQLKLEYPETAAIGRPLTVTAGMSLESETAINFSGIRLNAIRPCEKPLVIAQKEVFCRGIFQAASYTREVSIPVSPKTVPSSSTRGIRYKIRFYSRLPAPDGDPAGDREHVKEGDIVLVEPPDAARVVEANPVVLAIKGLKLQLQKDVFRPGETIKISYEARDMRELKVLLMQRSNVTCHCTQFGKVCTKVPVIPPSAAGSAKATNPTTGYLLLNVPKSAELSTRHSWEPLDRNAWSDKFGDYNEWFLSVTGRKITNETVQFEIPIEIAPGYQPGTQVRENDFFDSRSGDLDEGAGGGKEKALFKVKKITLVGTRRFGDGLSITVRNDTKKAFEGCTCKITGIKDMFFETQPWMVGFATLDAGEERNFQFNAVPAGVSEFRLDFECNDGHIGTFKKVLD